MTEKKSSPISNGRKTGHKANATSFKPGNRASVGHGRPVGSRNKFQEDYFRDLHALWLRRGPEILEEMANTEPGRLAQLAGSHMVKQVEVSEAGAFSSMSDEELLADITLTLRELKQVTKQETLQ